MTPQTRSIAAAALWLVLSSAHGQTATPPVQTYGDIAYRNGGAGEEEVSSIRESMKDYSMALAFSHAGTPRAEYVASVSITIKNAAGATVFEAPSVGPYLLLKLPAGRYSVTAGYKDVTQTRPIGVGNGAGPLVTFVWD